MQNINITQYHDFSFPPKPPLDNLNLLISNDLDYPPLPNGLSNEEVMKIVSNSPFERIWYKKLINDIIFKSETIEIKDYSTSIRSRSRSPIIQCIRLKSRSKSLITQRIRLKSRSISPITPPPRRIRLKSRCRSPIIQRIRLKSRCRNPITSHRI